jgi:transcriptional regulator with XRE-family HTH domain
MTFAERVGRNLRTYREEANLSQEQLAFLTGLHRTAVGQIERGERAPRSETAVRLCGVLAIEPNDLLAGLQWSSAKAAAGSMVVRKP